MRVKALMGIFVRDRCRDKLKKSHEGSIWAYFFMGNEKKRRGIIVMKIKLTSNEVLSVKYILKINSAMTS